MAPPAPVEATNGTQHRLDVAALKPRMRRERELLLGVPRLEEKQAMRLCAVSPRPAGLLKVALERARNLRVHDRANVGLVDAHAEGVSGDHHIDVARVEAALDLALSFRREAGVEVLGGKPLVGERLGGLLGAARALRPFRAWR